MKTEMNEQQAEVLVHKMLHPEGRPVVGGPALAHARMGDIIAAVRSVGITWRTILSKVGQIAEAIATAPDRDSAIAAVLALFGINRTGG